jgi:hypothetical protein
MKQFNYYSSEFSQLIDSEYFKSIKVYDGTGTSTKQLDLNLDSIPVLMKFLSKELKKLTDKDKKEGKK